MVFAERAFVVQDGGIFLLVDTFVGNFCYVESRYVQCVETLKLRKEAVICILRIPMSSPISTWIPSKAFSIFFVAENAHRIRGFLPCTALFFHSQLVGATLFLLKQSFVLFHSKFLCKEPIMCIFALVYNHPSLFLP